MIGSRFHSVALASIAIAVVPLSVHADEPGASISTAAPLASEAPRIAPAPVPSAPAAAAANDPCGGAARLLATLNRPTIGYSTCAVPKDSIVLEEGYQTTFQGGGSPNVTITFPQGFERVGVADRLELDLIGPNYNRSNTASGLTTGYSDLGLGFKYELPQRGRFTYAFDGLATAATGTGGFSAGGPSQTVNLDIAYSASPAIGIGTTLAGSSSAGFYTVGSATAKDGRVVQKGQRFGFFLPSIVITAQIPNYYQFYAEFVGQTKLAPAQGGHVFTDFGLQKLLGPYLEIDAEYGVSFTPLNGSRFQYAGLGAGIRVK